SNGPPDRLSPGGRRISHLSALDGTESQCFGTFAGHSRAGGRLTVERAMRRAVCPGSFDPVTNGHLDIIARASGLFDEVFVAVFVNQSKRALFTIDERLEMLRDVTKPYPNVRVDSFHGLVVDYCRAQGAEVVVKGLRAVSDFDYELQMAQMNLGLGRVE